MMIAIPAAGRSPARLLSAFLLLFLAACGARDKEVTRNPVPEVPGYGVLQDDVYTIPAVDPQYLVEPNRRAEVAYPADDKPGTIVVDPFAKFLFLVGEGGTATRYPIAVGREGRGFRSAAVVGDLREWPSWQPTANMLRSEPEVYGAFAGGIPGGVASPLGARAIYLYRGGKDTRFRIHGTNDVQAIGNAGTAGCIRLFNQDIIDLYARVSPGTKVRVRTYEESVQYEGEAVANRGVELPPRIVPPEEIYGAVAEQQAAAALASPPVQTAPGVFTQIN
ncbi:MAG: L,D-transpeptidase [Paracoccaceae bacterium]